MMRKKLLFLIAIATFGFSLANTNYQVSTTSETYFTKAEKTFTFVENGITFSVFQNGEFDFYMAPRNRVYTHVNYGALNITYNAGFNYDAYVQYDHYGAIVQIANVPVYYDYYGRVKRVGNININYRANRLASIGGMSIFYNNYGRYSHYSGYINVYNRNYVYHPYHNYFVKPLYDRCVVSYNPYRKHYKEKRHAYYKGKKHPHKKKSFQHIDARVRIAKVPIKKPYRNYTVQRNTQSNYTTQRSPVKRSNAQSNHRYNKHHSKLSSTKKVVKTHERPKNKTVQKRRHATATKRVVHYSQRRSVTANKAPKKPESDQRKTTSRSRREFTGRSI